MPVHLNPPFLLQTSFNHSPRSFHSGIPQPWSFAMVVLDKLRVNILCNAQTIKEHADLATGTGPDNRLDLTSDATKTVMRYLEAKPLKEYFVRVAVRKGFDFGPQANCLSFSVYIDGDRVRTVYISKSVCEKRSGFHYVIKGMQVSSEDGWRRHAFSWENLVTSEILYGCVKSLLGT